MKTIKFNSFNNFYLEHKHEADALITDVLNSGKYIRNKNIAQLEQNLCTLCNREYALTTASCTDAIFFALKSAGIKPGDEVIMPSFSYIASLSPVLMCGAIPVFADIKPDSLVLDIDIIEDLINENTKAVIFVQLFGNITDLSKLQTICKKNDVVLIEDAAQGLGSKINNKNGASQGDISCISFDPTKIVSAYGTGGAALTNDEHYFTMLQMLIHHGRNHAGEFEVLGYNSKIPELNAALINLQLKYLNTTLAQTNDIADSYINRLKNINELEFVKIQKNSISSFHKFVIKAKNRDGLKQVLAEKNIDTRIHYSPLLHQHKLLKNFKVIKHDLSVSDQTKEKVLSLPIYPGLKKDKIDYICDCIENFYKK
ncbi:MAG: DegT/DnrJ/EryC1/StrS family aminotransferase [Bacteroidales bacterium]